MTRFTGPWARNALLALAGCDLVVLLALAVAWRQASQLATPQQQMRWVDVAGAALLVGLGVHVGWLVAGRRLVGQRSRALDGATTRVLLSLAPDLPTQVVTGASMTLFHLPACPMVAGRSTEPLSAADAVDRGLEPCAMCRAAA
ncbi:MAG: hypothetical protein JWO12_1918 [Frankiales bacterium]|nr:hypothetical protein [Frankiales bacterium]